MTEQAKPLKELIAAEPARAEVVAECVSLVDAEVKAKSGLSGVAIKGAYGTVKKIKPRFVPEVVDALLDDWLDRIEPFYQSWCDSPQGTLAEYLTVRSDEVSEALLTVTDERAETTKHKTAKKLYTKMRPSAKNNVVAAIPKLGAMIERRLADDGAGDESDASPAEGTA